MVQDIRHLNQISNLKKSIKLGAKCSPLKLLLTRCKKNINTSSRFSI